MALVTEIASLQAFSKLLQENPGLVILKFGAEWCKPCKAIEPLVHEYYARIAADPVFSPRVVCGLIDVDTNFELYGFLKTKRQVSAIPAILCWYKNNLNYIPDDGTIGSDVGETNAFFTRVLTAVKQM